MGVNSIIKPHLSVSFLVLVLVSPIICLNTDGVLLLSFKYSILSDPLSVMENWNYDDVTPCSWKGVTCTEMGFPGTPDMFRVTSLVLPNSQLLGSIPPDLGFIQNLKHLDLSNNFLNGSLPDSFFNATELQVISLSGNEISGELPESISGMKSLQLLNLSDNAFDGMVPKSLTSLHNLTVVSLRSNYFSGQVPGGFNNSIEVLDLSSNLLNGSLPLDFGGDNLRYLNLSYNKLTGPITIKFAEKIPNNSTVDLSFNNLTGSIPQSMSLLNQKMESFRGNLDLCGKPLKNLCSIPSTLSTPPNITGTTTSPAIAVIPKPMDTTTSTTNSTQHPTTAQNRSGLKPGTIVAIAVADIAGISILALIILYVYQLKRKKQPWPPIIAQKGSLPQPPPPTTTISKLEVDTKKPTVTCPCLTTTKGEETSEESATSDSDHEERQQQPQQRQQHSLPSAAAEVNNNNEASTSSKGGKLVMVDGGETELEMETLLKASAYILGATGGSIVYKAVLENGRAFAVRRIGESGVERFKEFENQVRFIAKLRHPNLVRVRGFFWGEEDKLVVYDYISNGCLATSGQRKAGSSPLHLPLEVRFKIARGVARGLAFIHDKKHVHGNIKPSNILLTPDMEPIISDFGLDRLILGNNSSKSTNSGRHFGSQRSTTQDHPVVVTASPYSAPTTLSPYQAPESLKNLKPNPKWDVYSFGIVLLELLTGRVLSERELNQWTATAGSMLPEDKKRVLRLADVAIRGDVAAKEEALLACFKLAFSCASFVPQKRPSMKEALVVMEKIPSSTCSN